MTAPKLFFCRHISPSIFLIGLAALTVFALFALPLVGRTCYSPRLYFQKVQPTSVDRDSDGEGLPTEVRQMILRRDRFPKTFLAMIAGAGLALAGLTLQVLFRNPLASPFTLGVAGGAAFGATLWIHLAPWVGAWGMVGTVCGFSFGTWSAFLGALLATAVVFALFQRQDLSSDQLLLAGIAVSFLFSSLILALQYLADSSRSFQMIRWTMGEIDALDIHQLGPMAVAVVAAAAPLFFFSRELNILLTGEERALALGVSVGRFRLLLFFLSSALVAVVVAVCGPIGFVGLMTPHLCRLAVGSDHRVLVPTTALFGALFLACCFTVSRVALHPDILPVGVITSLFGGPFFLWLLLKRRNFRS